MFVCFLRRVDIPVSHFAFFFPEVSSGVSGTSPLPLALDTFFVFFLFFPLFDFTLGWDCGVSLSSFSFGSPSNGFISSGYWVRGSDFTGMVFWFPSVNWDYGIGGGADIVVAPEVVTDSVVVEVVVQTGFVVEGKMTSYLYSMFHSYPKMFNVCFIQNLLWYA